MATSAVFKVLKIAREVGECDLRTFKASQVTIRRDMVWYGMVWYGMVWYGMVWCGVVWYVIVCLVSLVSDAT